jgi:hypothetical protein
VTKQLPIGVTGNGVLGPDNRDPDIDGKFRLVKEAGVFDYYDKTPLPGEHEAYQRASAKYGLPIRAGGFFYMLGRDEPLLDWHLRMAREMGSMAHNVQIRTEDAAGQPVSDQRVADAYCRAAELGERVGVTPCFEVHVNMWSEHFGRVSAVGRLVERRGVKFNITLDHSHVIFKIDNPREQEVQGMRADVEAGRLVLDPFKPGSVVDEWIDANWVRHAHARAAVPANPVNVWAQHPDGRPGRGIQYPFTRPAPGAWHSEWHEEKLEPWKEVVRRLMRHHARRADSCLGQISTEFIPPVDYGAGAKYPLFDDNVACARWLRATWSAIAAAAA